MLHNASYGTIYGTIMVRRLGLLDIPTYDKVIVDKEILDKLKNRSCKIRFNSSKKQYLIVYFFDTKEKFLLHRLIMQPKIKHTVDHINGNPLDNRKSNLQSVTRKENTKRMHARRIKNG